MKKFLLNLLFMALMVPWMTQAQDLGTYTFHTGVDASKWVVLDATATELLGASNDDAASSVANIGFDFPFGEDTYSQFSVNSNGSMRLGAGAMGTSYSYGQFNNSDYMPKISGCAADLGTCTGGYIKYQLVGTAPERVLVVEYKLGHTWSSSTQASVLWQVQLHEDSSKVVIVYGPTAPSSNPSSYQTGLGTSINDFYLINPTTHAATYHTSSSGATSSGWHGINRYYTFVRPIITCPKPINLEISNVTTNAATATWTEVGTATQWIVEYGTAGFTQGSGNTAIVSASTYTISNLVQDRAYDFYVRAYCGANDSSMWRKGSFRTTCAPYTADMIPYTEDFESYTASSAITSNINYCWTRWSTSTSTTTVYPYVSTVTSNNVADKVMYMYGTAAFRSVLAMPKFEVELNTLQLSFNIVRTTTSGQSPLLVGVMSDPTDLSTFDTLAVVVCSQQSTWEHVEIPLSGYEGEGQYIAFCTPDGTISYNYIDDITLEPISECAVPTNVVVSNIIAEDPGYTAEITWAAAEGSAWLVEYGPAGFVRGTGTMADVSEATFTMAELSPSTGYDFYVRTLCNGEDTSAYSILCSFVTPCSEYMPIPFFENFEGYGFGTGVRPNCWTTVGNNSYPQVSVSQHYSGAASLYMYTTYSDASPIYVMSPEIDVETTPIHTLETSFRMLASSFGSSYPNTLIVGVATDTADLLNTFTPIDTISSTAGSVWEDMEVSFENYPANGTGKHIVFISTPISTESYVYNYIYLDDININVIPDCRRPRYIETANATQTTLTVKWTDLNEDNSAWELAYGPVGFDPDAIDDTEIGELVPNLTGDSVVLELQSGVLFDFYVRTDCGGDYSPWRGPVAGGAGIYEIPKVGMDTLTTCNAILVDHGGAAGSYGSNCSGSITLYPSSPDSVMAIVAGSLTTEASYDYVKIYDGISTFGRLLYSAAGTVASIDTVRSTQGPLTIQFTSDGSGERAGFQLIAACVEAPACPAVLNPSISSITGRSALVNWEYSQASLNAPTSFELEVFDEDGLVATYTATENFYMLSGLNPLTEYGVRITAACAADGSEGSSDSIAFETKCLAGGTAEIGDGSTTTSYFPTYITYDYSYSQQLILASELSGPNTYSSYSFNMISTTAQTRDIDVYIGHTSLSSLSASSYVPASDLTLVYSGEYDFETGLNTITFTTPFSYNGTSNLVVAVDDNTATWTSSMTFSGHSVPGMAIYYYRDDNDIDPTAPPQFYNSSVRGDIILAGECDGTTTCIAPNVVVTNVGVDQVDVIWAPGNTETSWAVDYREVGADTWTTANANCTATSYSFTNLNDATEYQFRFTSACGSSASRIVTVTTECAPISEYPFFEGFDTWTASSTADLGSICWNRLCNYTSGSTQYPYVSTSYPMSAPNSMYFYSSTSSYSILTLPKFNLPLDTLQVSFGMYVSDVAYTLQVGVMSDPNDISTLIPLGVAVSPTTNNMEMFEFPLSSSPIKDGHIAIISPQGTYSYSYMDNVEVNPIPTCPRPRDVRIPSETITQTSAVIVWSDTNATSWTVEYGPAGFTQGTGTVENASDTTVTLTGLNPMTRYDVYVTAHCSSTDQSLPSFKRTFVTECGVISTFPFTESFTGYATGTSTGVQRYPYCWTGASNYSTSYPYFNLVDNNVAQYLYCYVSHDTLSGTKYTYVAMPAIDSSTLQMRDMMVSFRAKASSSSASYDQRLYIGVMTDPTNEATFTPVDTVDLTGHTNWVNIDELELSSYTGTGNYLAFFVRPHVISGSTGYSTIYIDDIELDVIPTCYRPTNVHVESVTATSIELAWTDRNNATSWVVEYGPMGFAIGTGTTVNVTTNPTTTITGLTANTNYDFYVKSICSATDESRYTRVHHFATSQVPATIPYTYNFEDAAEWNNWGTNTGLAAVNWYRGTATASQGSYAMYVSANNGQTNSTQMATVNTSAYRDLDLGTRDTNFTVSFTAKAGGSPEDSYDGLMIFLVDPSVVVEGPTSAITSPWGNVNNLYRIGTVRMDTTFSEYVVELDTISGIRRLAFFYFNQNTSFVGGPAAVDDINIVMTSCPRPNSLQMTRLDATSADFSWNGTASGYWFYYRRADQDVMDSIYTTSNTYTLSGLEPDASYVCAVKSDCSSELSIYSDAVRFATPQILGQLPYFCGFEANEEETSLWGINNGTAENAWHIDSAARDSGSYALYISNDNGVSASYDETTVSLAWAYRDFFFPNAAATDTFEINFRWMAGGENGYDYCAIFVGEPAATTAGSGSLKAPTGSKQVASLCLNSAAFETKRIFLPASEYGGKVQRIFFAWRNDGSVGTQPPIIIDNFRILSPVAGCLPPVAVITPASTTAEFAFDVQGTYGMSCAVTGTTEWSEEQIAVDALTYTFTGLVPETTYEYRVRRICDSVTASNFAQGTFTTTELPCVAPTGFTASDITMTSATVAWVDSLANQEAWKVAYGYGNDASGWDTIDVTTPSVNLTGLFNNTEYTVRVRAYCSVEADVYGEWSEGFTFRTAACATVSNITSSAVTNSGATISWTPGASETKWEIAYGIEGFNESTVTPTVVEGTPSYTITGLESDFTYDVYVRAVCAEGVTSAWSNKIQFRTTVGINTASTDNVRVQIYPNPANSEATVSVDGINGKVEFVVADMNGRMIVTETINCEGSLVKTIDVSNLAKGAYFVHIYNDDFNTTRKLIVK